MLILDIYGYSDAVLTEELQAEKARLWDNWEIAWEQDFASGMFCRMYHPKLSGDLTRLDVCPPALVFRGSEMNEADIDELAVHLEVNCDISATGLPGLVMDASSFSPPIPVVSPSGRFPPTSTRAELRAAGLLEQPLILPSTGREVIAASLGGLIGLGNININWTGSASLFYGQNGDWPTNISQALGNVPRQYQQAIIVAQEAATEALADWNGRLMVLGHSLGGGLASAAALAAVAAQPDLALRCNTYNAAGLSAKTAKEANSSLAQAAGANINANNVRGDILTSLQTPGLIPLVSDVLRWGGVTLPPSTPSQAPSYGYSPGGPPSMMFSHFERSPKWHALPFLFPLSSQNLVQGDLSTLQKVFDAARGAADFRIFVSNLLAMIFREFGDSSGALRSWHMYDFYTAMDFFETQFRIAGPMIVSGAQENPPNLNFPTVNFGDSTYMRNQVNPFINGLMRDTVEFGQIMLATVDYHMWDACAYTFLLDPPTGTFR